MIPKTATSEDPFDAWVRSKKSTATQTDVVEGDPFRQYAPKKKEQSNPFGQKLPVPDFQFTSESVSESTEPVTEPTVESPTGFLEKDIEQSQFFSTPEIPEFDPRSLSEPDTPQVQNNLMNEEKIVERQKILTETDALSSYAKDRVNKIKSEIHKLENVDLERFAEYGATSVPGAPLTKTFKPGAEAIQQQIEEKKRYLNKFQSALADQAAFVVGASEDLTTVDDAKLKSIGAKYLKTMNNTGIASDEEVLRTIDDIGANKTDIDRTSQNINYKLYKAGADVMAKYYNDVADKTFQEAKPKLQELNSLLQQKDAMKPGLDADLLQSSINDLMQDPQVKSYIDSERNAATYLKKSNDAINEFPQVKRQAMRQQLNDAFFNMTVARQSASKDVGSLGMALGSWLFGEEATQSDIKSLSKATGIPEYQVNEIIGTDIKGWFGSAKDAGVRIPGALVGLAQSTDETIAKSVMGAKRFFNTENVEAENRLLSDRVQDYNLKAQKAKLFDDAGKLNFNPYSVFNTMGSGVGQTAVYAAPSLITGGLASSLSGVEKVGKLISMATTTGTGFVGSYEDAYKEAKQYTTDEDVARSYATKVGLVNGLSEIFLEPADIAKKLAIGSPRGKDAFSAFSKMYKEKGAGAAMAQGLKEFGKVAWTENIEELSVLIGETKFKESELGVQTSPAEFINQAIETGITTTLTTLPLGVGAGINANRDVSSIRKQALFEAGNEPDLYRERLKALLDNGIIDQKHYNDRVAVVSTMSGIVANINQSETQTGKKLSYDQKANLAAQQFRIDLDNKRLKSSGVLEAEKPLIEADIKEATEIQRQELEDEIVPQEAPTEAGVTEVAVTEKEQAAIEGLQSKDFSNSPVKPYTDVIQNPGASIADKKEALKGLSDQLTAKGTEITVGEALGKEADLIYDLGYEPAQESEAIREVTKTPQEGKDVVVDEGVKIKYGGKDKDLKGNPHMQWMKPKETSEQVTNRLAEFVEASDYKGREQSTFIDRKGESVEVKLRNDDGKWNWYEPKSKKPFASFDTAKDAIKFIQEQPFWDNGELNKNGRNDAYFAKVKAEQIKSELDNGNILEDINDGKITANDAKKIIESAGLEVPKGIIELSKSEQSLSTSKPTQSKESASSTGNEGNSALRDVDGTAKALDNNNSIPKDVLDRLNYAQLTKQSQINYEKSRGNYNEFNAKRIQKNYENNIKSLKETGKLDYPTEYSYTDGTISGISQELSEAYHKAKADGSNPELVKSVEEALSKPNTNESTPTKEVSPKVGVSSNSNEVPKANTEEPPVEEEVIELTPKEKLASEKSLPAYRAKYPGATQEEYQANRVSATRKKDRIKKIESKPTISKEPVTAKKEPNKKTPSTKKLTSIEEVENELRNLFAADRMIGIPVGEKTNTIDQYLEKANAVLSQLYPDATITTYDTAEEYYDKEGRPVGSAGVFHPQEQRLALNLELIAEHGAENTIFHEVIHPIVNEAILSKEGALDDVFEQLKSLKDIPGMNAVHEHIQAYAGRGINIQKIEGITEFLTQVADGRIDLANIPEKSGSKIIDLINKIFEALGISLRISTATDLKRLSEAIKESFDNADASAVSELIGRRVVADNNTLSPLQVQLREANAPENLIAAVPNDTKLREGFLTDTERLVESLLGLSGNYSIKENKIRIGKFYSSLFGGRDKVLIHEAVHAATMSVYGDILRNESGYTEEQVSSVRDLNEIAWQYIENTSTSAKMFFPRLYGTINPYEFIAEFIANKNFRDYISKNNPTKKTNIAVYLWGRILSMLGVSKAQINKELIDNIQRGIDVVLNINASKISSRQALDTILPEEQERIVKDIISRSEGIPQDKLKAAIKKYTGWSDEKIDSFFAKTTGITHAQTQETASEFSFEGYEPAPETFDEWDKEAMSLIESGYDIEGLIKRLEEGKLPTNIEQRIMGFYLATQEAAVEKDPSKENLETLMRAVHASDVGGGRLVGQSLAARKGFRVRDNSLAGFFIGDEEANEAPLTDNQRKEVVDEYNKIQDAQRLYEEKIISLEKENARLRAEKELSKEKKSSTKSKKTHSEYVSERKEILTSIKDKLKAARTGESGLTAVPVPYAKELFVIAPDVMKLTRSLLSEGVSKLDDIVREIHSSIKDSIDGLTEKDIHDIIAGDYNTPRPTRREINKSIVDLRTEAKLINRLSELKEGSVPKTEKAERERNREIESLKKQIKNHDITKLAEVKKRINKQISDLENDLKTGNYQEPETTDTQLPVKLDKEAIELKDKLIKLRQQRAERLAKLKYENRTLRKRAVDRTLEIMNVPRTIMASMDYSAPLRQAVIPTVSHPIMAARAAAEMFRQSISQKRFDRWFFDLQQTPRYELMKRVKLYVADPHDPRLSTKEEAFMNNLAEKIPFLGRLIKGSERAYVGFLNKMRVDLFNRLADGFENEGFTYENNPELYDATARMVNNFTGRGGLGPIESTAPVLNSIFFSPRLIASRFNILGLSDIATFGKGFYSNLPPKLRVAALGDLAKFVGVGTTLLGMLALWASGGDDDDKDKIQVETDPRSSDFGKIRSGNTRWDIWGGFQPYVRLIAQLITGDRKATSSGQISSVNKFGQDKGTLLTRFVRGKLAPVPATALNLLTGRNIVGEKVTVKSEAMAHLQPLIVSDMKDAIKDRGLGALFTHGLPSVFGVGVQTYLPRGYDNVDTKAPVYKELYEKGLNLTTPEQSEEMDDKIYDKFTKRQRVLFKEKWDNVIKYGAYISEEGNPTIDIDRGVSIKPFNELSNTELTTLMKSISNSATRTTKKELDIKPLKK